MKTTEEKCQILIIGQGAAAFAAALYAGRYQMKTIIVGETFGGETATGGLIENYPGYPEIDGFDLMMKFREQADKYGVPIINEKITSLSRSGSYFSAIASDGASYITDTVIIAVGRERRTLGITNEVEWTGKGISYCSTCDAPLHRENTVAVVGGGDAAVKGSVLLSKYASLVYLIYRKAKLTRPEPVNIRQLEKACNIKPIFNTNVVKLNGNDGLSSINLDSEYNGSIKLLVDGLFIEAGAKPRIELAKQLGAKLNSMDEIIVDKMMRTNVKGVFAAGDITDASGDLKQTLTASAQGSLAATAAYEEISSNPEV